ncbi:MAG: DUF4184 family protein [Candidatus Acidiferrales bacterium]
MAFTFSHPAAVLPLRAIFKRWIPFSALVVGSMVPDASYYLPMPEHFRRHSHTLLGTFSTSLPAGILVLLIFYWAAGTVVYLLPSPHREALQPELKAPPATITQALLVALGVVMGAWTHVVWDSCTHSNGWIVRHTPLLQRQYFSQYFGTMMTGYNFLQYLTSAIGLCVLVYAYDRWMKASGFRPWAWRKPGWRVYLWLGVLASCCLAATIESRTMQMIVSGAFLHSRHYGLVFITSFVRDTLIAVCVVVIAAKLLRPGGDGTRPVENEDFADLVR